MYLYIIGFKKSGSVNIILTSKQDKLLKMILV